jgi:hypothetical protein
MLLEPAQIEWIALALAVDIGLYHLARKDVGREARQHVSVAADEAPVSGLAEERLLVVHGMRRESGPEHEVNPTSEQSGAKYSPKESQVRLAVSVV